MWQLLVWQKFTHAAEKPTASIIKPDGGCSYLHNVTKFLTDTASHNKGVSTSNTSVNFFQTLYHITGVTVVFKMSHNIVLNFSKSLVYTIHNNHVISHKWNYSLFYSLPETRELFHSAFLLKLNICSHRITKKLPCFKSSQGWSFVLFDQCWGSQTQDCNCASYRKRKINCWREIL
jgi:hypothetical protein